MVADFGPSELGVKVTEIPRPPPSHELSSNDRGDTEKSRASGPETTISVTRRSAFPSLVTLTVCCTDWPTGVIPKVSEDAESAIDGSGRSTPIPWTQTKVGLPCAL